MTRHAFAFTVGPVQTFIAAARRTRDLWMGSLVLSELSKAAALAIAKGGGELIFPPLEEGDVDLQPTESVQALTIANIILAILPEGTAPGQVRETTRAAVQDRWRAFASAARANAGTLIDEQLWDAQVNDVVETFSAWVPFDDGISWQETRQRLMRLVAGRKALRDFDPAQSRLGVRKSSLDGARESVIRQDPRGNLSPRLQAQLRLASGEELGIVGVTKRLGSAVTFPSVSRVAVDSWIRSIRSSDQGRIALDEVREICRDSNTNFATGTGEYYKDFGWDGEFLYKSRLEVMLRDEPLREPDRDALVRIQEMLTPLFREFGEPNPYFAMIVADGDHVGELLSQVGTVEGHRDFSRRLVQFAHKARDIVVNLNRGVLVYSGGDDVLAFLPVDTCINAARQLRTAYTTAFANFRDAAGRPPTFSVGLAIGHFLEPLEDLLQHGREAEHDAKEPDRNGLAVHIHVRAGSTIRVRSQWTTNLDGILLRWVHLLRESQVPERLAHELLDLSGLYEIWPQKFSEAVEKDLRRILKRKEPASGRIPPQVVEELLSHLRGDLKYNLRQFAKEFLVARNLARKVQNVGGEA